MGKAEGIVGLVKDIATGGSSIRFFGKTISEWIPIAIFIVVCLYFAYYIYLEYVDRTYISDAYG